MLVDKIYSVEETINEYEIIQNILNESQRLTNI